jgi:hypothetical protein
MILSYFVILQVLIVFSSFSEEEQQGEGGGRREAGDRASYSHYDGDLDEGSHDGEGNENYHGSNGHDDFSHDGGDLDQESNHALDETWNACNAHDGAQNCSHSSGTMDSEEDCRTMRVCDDAELEVNPPSVAGAATRSRRQTYKEKEPQSQPEEVEERLSSSFSLYKEQNGNEEESNAHPPSYFFPEEDNIVSPDEDEEREQQQQPSEFQRPSVGKQSADSFRIDYWQVTDASVDALPSSGIGNVNLASYMPKVSHSSSSSLFFSGGVSFLSLLPLPL